MFSYQHTLPRSRETLEGEPSEFRFPPTIHQKLGDVDIESATVPVPRIPPDTTVSLSAKDSSIQYQVLDRRQGRVIQDWTRSPTSVSPTHAIKMRGTVPSLRGHHVMGTLTLGTQSASWILKAAYDAPLVAYQYCDDAWSQQQWDDRIGFLADLGYTRVIGQLNWGGFRQYADSRYEVPLYMSASRNNTAFFVNACLEAGVEPCIGKICHQLAYQASSDFRSKMYAQGRGAKSAIWHKGQWELVASSGAQSYGVGGYDLPYMLAPGDQRNVEMIVGICQEIAEQFSPKQIVLDYIRHNGARMDASLEQMARFNAYVGENFRFVPEGDINQWPEVVLPNYRNARVNRTGAMYDTFKVWQAQQITDEVAAIKKELPSDVELGAAVFCGGPTNTGQNASWFLMAQDWPTWMRSGVLNVAYPMAYQGTVQEFDDALRNPEWHELRDLRKAIIPIIKNDHSGWIVPGTPAQREIKAQQIEIALNTYNYAGVGIWQVSENGSNLPSSADVAVCDNLVPNFSSYCRSGMVAPFETGGEREP